MLLEVEVYHQLNNPPCKDDLLIHTYQDLQDILRNPMYHVKRLHLNMGKESYHLLREFILANVSSDTITYHTDEEDSLSYHKLALRRENDEYSHIEEIVSSTSDQWLLDAIITFRQITHRDYFSWWAGSAIYTGVHQLMEAHDRYFHLGRNEYTYIPRNYLVTATTFLSDLSTGIYILEVFIKEGIYPFPTPYSNPLHRYTVVLRDTTSGFNACYCETLDQVHEVVELLKSAQPITSDTLEILGFCSPNP